MLSITIPKGECWNEQTNTFISTEKDVTIVIEHSLVSISKWESKYHKPFLSKEKKTNEQLIDYIMFMTITQNVPKNVYYCLTAENLKQVNEYIEDSMTATTFQDFSQSKPSKKNEVLTSELIYYWMIANNIPMECQKWHLNRLITLIRVCGIKNNPGKKMSKGEVLSKNRALNEARKKQLNTRG